MGNILGRLVGLVGWVHWHYCTTSYCSLWTEEIPVCCWRGKFVHLCERHTSGLDKASFSSFKWSSKKS